MIRAAMLARALALSLLACVALRPLDSCAQSRPGSPVGCGRDGAAGDADLTPPSPPGFAGVWHEAEHTPKQLSSVVYDTRRKRVIEIGGSYDGFGSVAAWSYSPRGDQRWQAARRGGRGSGSTLGGCGGIRLGE